jgi:hypothetical protein
MTIRWYEVFHVSVCLSWDDGERFKRLGKRTAGRQGGAAHRRRRKKLDDTKRREIAKRSYRVARPRRRWPDVRVLPPTVCRIVAAHVLANVACVAM